MDRGAGELRGGRAGGVDRPRQTRHDRQADDRATLGDVRAESVGKHRRRRLRGRRQVRLTLHQRVERIARELDRILIAPLAEVDEQRNDVDPVGDLQRRRQIAGRIGDHRDPRGHRASERSCAAAACRASVSVRADSIVPTKLCSASAGGVEDRIADRHAVRAAVRDDAGAAHAEQRRAAVGVVADAGTQLLERRPHQPRAELSPPGRFVDRLANHQPHELARPLRGFEDDVADEPVADDDVGRVLVEILAFDVTDELQRRLVEQRRRFERLLVALAALLADRDDSYSRVLDPERDLARRRRPSARTARAIPAGNRRSHRHRTTRAVRPWSAARRRSPDARSPGSSAAESARSPETRRCCRPRPPRRLRRRAPSRPPPPRLVPCALRIACAAAASIAISPVTCTTAIPLVPASSGRIRCSSPTSVNAPTPSRCASSAPATTSAGAWSPPIASIAIRGCDPFIRATSSIRFPFGHRSSTRCSRSAALRPARRRSAARRARAACRHSRG